MRQLLNAHTRGSVVLALAIAVSACDAGKGEGDATKADSRATGSIQAALTVGGARHDVTAVYYKVVGAGSTCGDLAIAEITSPLEEEALPGSVLPPGAGTHAGADGLFVLPPGNYRVCATPMSSSGPSLECASTEGTASVISEATTEILLVSQCSAPANGGLDTGVALNDPPTIEDLDITPSKFITQCERATITATATDPDGDAFSYSWAVVAGAGTLSGDGNTATFAPAGAGDSTVRVTVTDATGASTALTFPIHVSAADCGTPECEVFGTDSFGYVGCSRVEDVPSCDDISLTGSLACSGDDCATNVPLPFAFDFYGASQTNVDIVSNGKLGFPGSTSYSNSCSLEPQTIATFWDDLLPSNRGNVLYQTLGTAPARRFVVQWNVPHITGGSLFDIRAVLFEGSNDIRFCYADTSVENPSADSGASATAGISGSGSSLVYSCGAPQLTDGRVVEFTHPDTVATCSDGVQNQGETGVDCGGPCSTCSGASEYAQSFTQNQSSPAQCDAWNSFRASLDGNFTAITIKGSQDPVGVTCTGAAANTLCQALHSGTQTGPVACGGRSWTVGTGCGPGDAVELSANGDSCSCSTGYIARPCIDNENWGGVNGYTCGAQSQTISVACTSGVATCSDGIQNQGETGVDCGGPCAPCGGGGGDSTFTFTDTTADDVSSTALYDFFAGLGPVNPSQYILFEINGAGSGGAWCADHADFYVNSYLHFASGSNAATSGSWVKYSRPTGGSWSGPDTAGYTNYFGSGCDGTAYSWCSEWGIGGLMLGVMPGDASVGESYASSSSNGAGWSVRVAVGADRLSTCGF